MITPFRICGAQRREDVARERIDLGGEVGVWRVLDLFPGEVVLFAASAPKRVPPALLRAPDIHVEMIRAASEVIVRIEDRLVIESC